MLYFFGGLPGTGKTTLARGLARDLAAAYLRIDSIEQAIGSGWMSIGSEGYHAAYAIAEDNLRLGLNVVADAVNPVQVARRAWYDIAQRVGGECVGIEVVCSDPGEHRRRVEGRLPDRTGLRLPTWNEVRNRKYDPWHRPDVVIDTDGRSVDESRAELRKLLARFPRRPSAWRL